MKKEGVFQEAHPLFSYEMYPLLKIFVYLCTYIIL